MDRVMKWVSLGHMTAASAAAFTCEGEDVWTVMRPKATLSYITRSFLLQTHNMGYYIETPKSLHKARQLVDIHSARLELAPFFDPTGQRIGICVVENGPFDAAGIAFSKDETEVFADVDDRPKTWLSLPRETVIKICPMVEHALVPLVNKS